MNFNVVESHQYNDLNEIYPFFVEDYVFSKDLKNPEIKEKYNLTHNEFKTLRDRAKKEYNLVRRSIRKNVKNYYPVNYGFHICKNINGKNTYLGFVKHEKNAIKLVEICKQHNWDIDVCKRIIKEYGG